MENVLAVAVQIIRHKKNVVTQRATGVIEVTNVLDEQCEFISQLEETENSKNKTILFKRDNL